MLLTHKHLLVTLRGSVESDSPSKHNYLAPHTGRRDICKVLVRALGYMVAARHLHNSEETAQERYSHLGASELGGVATEVLAKLAERLNV